jgi:hypothetical protein
MSMDTDAVYIHIGEPLCKLLEGIFLIFESIVAKVAVAVIMVPL